MSLSMASFGEEPTTPEPKGPPGQLDVIEGTAISLDGRLAEGLEASGYRWKIVQGEGGRLIGETREDAVFIAPKVEKGVKEFIVELTVMYSDQPMSTRRLSIRVLPADPDKALEGASEDDTQWLQDYYKKDSESQSSTPATGSSGSGGPNVSIGVSGGSGGYRRGGVGLSWGMSYPISQPVDVPPPGQTRMPGEGKWDRAHPVPHDQLRSTFPKEIADRYEVDEPPAASEPEPDDEP